MGERPASCESLATVLSRGSFSMDRVEMIAQDLEGRPRRAGARGSRPRSSSRRTFRALSRASYSPRPGYTPRWSRRFADDPLSPFPSKRYRIPHVFFRDWTRRKRLGNLGPTWVQRANCFATSGNAAEQQRDPIFTDDFATCGGFTRQYKRIAEGIGAVNQGKASAEAHRSPWGASVPQRPNRIRARGAPRGQQARGERGHRHH